MQTEKTTVIFRLFKPSKCKDPYSPNYSKGGEVIALFPYEIADKHGNIVSYMHIGQHGVSSPLLIADTVPAKPEEYADLKRELESIGYVLDVKARRSWARYRKIKRTVCI